MATCPSKWLARARVRKPPSFGGFSTQDGVTLHPGRFRAIVIRVSWAIPQTGYPVSPKPGFPEMPPRKASEKIKRHHEVNLAGAPAGAPFREEEFTVEGTRVGDTSLCAAFAKWRSEECEGF